MAALLNLYAGLQDISVEEATELFRGKQTRVLKDGVVDVCVEKLKPIREKFEDFRKDETYVERTLAQGEEEATQIAARTMKQVRDVMGLHQ